MNLKKLIAVLLLIGGIVSAFAWHEDKPTGAKFFAEESDDVRAAQQGDQRVVGEVGAVVEDTRPSSSAHSDESDSEAANVVGAVEDPAQALKEVERVQREDERGPWNLIAWCAVCGAIGFGGVVAARQWLNRWVPEPPPLTRRKW
jgi:hypothetical protein